MIVYCNLRVAKFTTKAGTNGHLQRTQKLMSVTFFLGGKEITATVAFK